MTGPGFDIHACPSPAYVVDDALLHNNLELLRQVQEDSGARILLALKGFAMWDAFPLVKEYLVGITASGRTEPRLAAKPLGARDNCNSRPFRRKGRTLVLGKANNLSFTYP